MADWFQIEIYVEGEQEKVKAFLEEEFDGLDLKDESIRVQIDDVDPSPYGVIIVGQQAWDEGAMWLRSMREKYPDLNFFGQEAIWESM